MPNFNQKKMGEATQAGAVKSHDEPAVVEHVVGADVALGRTVKRYRDQAESAGVDALKASGLDCGMQAPTDIIPITDTVLNWGGGDLDWSSGGTGASSSRGATGASGVDAITRFNGRE